MAAPMFRTQGVVYNAPGVASKTGSIAKSLGATSVFLVTDQMLVSIGMAKIIVDSVEAAGLQCVVFDGVVPNPTVSCINEGIRQLQACAPGTVVVTLGGGSVMDCGKSIAVISAQEKDADVRDFYGQPKLNPKTDTIDLRSMAPKKRPTKLSPRIIAIPTTSGTGSETNGAAVVTDDVTHKKYFFSNDKGRASAIILDAKLTVGMPLYPTASCGMDVLAHALEAFTSNRTNSFSDAVAYQAIREVAVWLPAVMKHPKDIEARGHMQMASYMAAMAFDSAQLGLMHATGHQLTALYGAPHGQTLATVMPHVMEFNIQGGGKSVAKYAQVAQAFGVFDPNRSQVDNARRAIGAVSRLSIDIGTAKSIRMLGGTPSDLSKLTEQALLDISGIFNDRPASRSDIARIFEAAMENDKLYPPPVAKL